LKTAIKVEHVGIAVDDLDKYIKIYEGLGGKVTFRGKAKDFEAECVFVDMGNIEIELIKGTVPGNHINKFVEKYGCGLHHIAVSSDNIKLINPKTGAKPGMEVSFNPVNKENRVLIENVRYRKN